LFYQAVPILGEEDSSKKYLEFSCLKVADTIASSFKLLGIAVSEVCNTAFWRYNGVNY
jgi:hypothetical protein